MQTIYFIYTFVLGLIFGSFLNVVIYRYNTGRTLMGRSFCFGCNQKLRWFEMVPVLSFLWQKGRCRTCKSKISWQYPLVELLGAILFVIPVWKFYPALPLVAFWWVVLAFFGAIAVYDFKHGIIPNELVYFLIALAFLKPVFLSWPLVGLDFWLIPWIDMFVAGALPFLFFWALWFFSKGQWMGFGDAKLAFAMGALLGPHQALGAFILAFLTGAAVGIFLIILSRSRGFLGRHFHLKSEVPFAPFLILGFILQLAFSFNFLSLF